MRLLVIGGGGQVGTKLIERAKGKFQLYVTYLTRKPPLERSRLIQMDKTNHDAIQTLFRKLRPDAVVDTAAMHNVDYCEDHKDEAKRVNVDGTRNVAHAAEEAGSRFVFISTDYVFDGTKSNYTEEDSANPINYYGQTKFDAERTVAEISRNYAIVRPSVVYSYLPHSQAQSSSGKPLNFAMWLVQKLTQNAPLRIVSDQYSSPTLADDLADALLRLVEASRNGIYHAAGATRISRYEFALKLAATLGFDTNLISPITTEELRQAAKRPHDSSLSIDRIRRDLGVQMPSLDMALGEFRRQSIEGDRT